MESEARAKLICQLERILAKNCHQKNLKNNQKFRYPVEYIKQGKKGKSNGLVDLDNKDIKTMHYTFGTNILDVGNALEEMVDFILKNCEMTTDSLYYYFDESDDECDDLDKYEVF